MIAAGRIFAPEKIRGFMGYAARRPLCLAGLVIALMLGISSRTDHLSQKTVFRKRSAATASGEGRKVYPLSVIHGGAYSAEELNRARQLDSVVGAHYADFGRSPVVQHTPANLFMYVSYRKSDKVYWTRTKRRIPKGESVLSDGKNLARTRCGNRLSFTPQQPLSPENELSEEAFDVPEVPKVSIPFDAPTPPAAEADLYVPASPLLNDLFSPMPPPFAVSYPIATARPGGAYAPIGILGAGSPWGGTPLFLGGSGFLSRNQTAGQGVPLAVPAISGAPEPATTKLLLVSALVFVLLCLTRRIHFKL
jgi:hypothetical protein